MLIKGKVASIMLAGALVTGGAVAGASSDTFSGFLDNATDSLFTKVASLAGYQVYKHGEQAKTEVENHVQTQANQMANQVGGHYVSEVNRGKGEVTSHKDGLKTEITNAINDRGTEARGMITDAVDDEVSLTNSELEDVAQDKAQSMIDRLNNSFTVPGDGRPAAAQ